MVSPLHLLPVISRARAKRAARRREAVR